MILLETIHRVNVTYNLGNLADWVSAIATLAAVFISLYLANRKPKPFLVIKSAYFSEEPDKKRSDGTSIKGMKECIIVWIENDNNYPVAMVTQNHHKILKPILGIKENTLYISGGNEKSKMRSMKIENFDNLIWKQFKIRDIYSNAVYKFRFIKKNNEWVILYPLRLKDYMKVIRCIVGKIKS